MKKYIPLLIAVLALQASISWGVTPTPAPHTPRLIVDENGNLVNLAHPLPVKATGTTAISQAATTLGTSSVLLLTSTPQLISPVAGQRCEVLFASGTFAYALGSTTAIVGRPEVYNATIVGSYAVSVWTTATQTYLGIDRHGD